MNKILVMLFGHLSNNLESPEKAKLLLCDFVDLLKREGFEAVRASFGTHKRTLWEIAGNVADMSFF